MKIATTATQLCLDLKYMSMCNTNIMLRIMLWIMLCWMLQTTVLLHTAKRLSLAVTKAAVLLHGTGSCRDGCGWQI